MNWRLVHRDVGVDEKNEVTSRSLVVLEQGEVEIKISDNAISENHSMSAKRALMDAAYKLEKFAFEMKHKAEKYQ
jgi:hypothetical protein